MAITWGTQLFYIYIFFFFLWKRLKFGTERYNGQGHLSFGVDIILVKHVKELSKHILSMYFPGQYTNPKYAFFMFFLELFIIIYWGVTLIVTCTPFATDLGYQKH